MLSDFDSNTTNNMWCLNVAFEKLTNVIIGCCQPCISVVYSLESLEKTKCVHVREFSAELFLFFPAFNCYAFLIEVFCCSFITLIVQVF